MARYDLHARTDGPGWLLDVQVDLLSDLNTRVVVPLLPEESAPTPARRLNPVIEIRGVRHVMATQFLSAVPCAILGPVAGRLTAEEFEIAAALDMLLTGL